VAEKKLPGKEEKKGIKKGNSAGHHALGNGMPYLKFEMRTFCKSTVNRNIIVRDGINQEGRKNEAKMRTDPLGERRKHMKP